MKKILLLLIIILSGCSGKPNFMKFDVIFYAPIGTNYNEIGSNLDDLKQQYSNQSLILNDYIDVPKSIQLYRNKIYIADNYNKKVIIYSLSENNSNIIIISNKGEGYEFDTPLSVLLNKFGEIYVLATISNSSKNQNITNDENSYIFKFTPEGKFIYSIGKNGINSQPMSVPEKIDIDLFNNLYVYEARYENDFKDYDIKRYSIAGELTFEFDTKYISKTNTINNEVYISLISSIHNLKNNERLIITSQNYLIMKDGKKIETPSSFYNSIDIYSILRNSIIKNLFKSRKYYEDVLAVTYDDVAILYSYDEKAKGVKFRFVDLSGGTETETVYYAPQISSLYQQAGFWVDKNGEIYSIIVKDQKYFVLIKWRKVKSRS